MVAISAVWGLIQHCGIEDGPGGVNGGQVCSQRAVFSRTRRWQTLPGLDVYLAIDLGRHSLPSIGGFSKEPHHPGEPQLLLPIGAHLPEGWVAVVVGGSLRWSLLCVSLAVAMADPA